MDDALADFVIGEDDPLTCPHETKQLVNKPYPNSGARYCYQCIECGRRIGDWVSRAKAQTVMRVSEIPLFNFALESRTEKFFADLGELRRAQKMDELNEKRAAYWKYLQSDEWRVKRSLVMRHAQDTCEGCGSAAAVQVHHITYAHVMNEFLWELVAVCQVCHDKAHANNASFQEISARAKAVRRQTTKLIHEGKYAAEVAVELVEEEGGWPPYLSVDDARKLDAVRMALRAGDIAAASKCARVFELKPIHDMLVP